MGTSFNGKCYVHVHILLSIINEKHKSGGGGGESNLYGFYTVVNVKYYTSGLNQKSPTKINKEP